MCALCVAAGLMQGRHLLCPGSFDAGRMGCVDPGGCDSDHKCNKCGFKRLWSPGLRKKLVSSAGDLLPSVNPVWLQEVQWERYKTEKAAGEKQTLRNDRSG
jgi:hypothetical protein